MSNQLAIAALTKQNPWLGAWPTWPVPRLFRIDDNHHGEPQHAGDGEAEDDPDVTADQHGSHAIHQPGE